MEGGTHANDLFHEQMIMTLRPQIEEEMLPVHVLFFLPGLRGKKLRINYCYLPSVYNQSRECSVDF